MNRPSAAAPGNPAITRPGGTRSASLVAAARTRRPSAALLLALPAVLLVGGSTAAGATLDGPGSSVTAPAAYTTLKLHVRTTAFTTLDLGTAGPTPGDATYRKDDVTSAAGVHLGVMNSTCVANIPFVPSTEVDQICSGVIDLGTRGQIHWQSFTIDGPPPPPPPPPPAAGVQQQQQQPPGRSFGPWAILGGTGRYRTARGQIIDDGPGAADRVLRVQLSP